MTSSKPNYLPKAHLGTVTLEIRFDHTNLGETQAFSLQHLATILNSEVGGK